MKKLLLFALLAVLCAKAIGQTIGTETEPNDALASANLLVLGSYAANAAQDTGCHFNWTDIDYYRVDIPQAGVLNVTIPATVTGAYGLDIIIIDSATNVIIGTYGNATTPVTCESIICGGTYYIKVINCCSGGFAPGTYSYGLNVTFYPDVTECNNSTFTAYPVNPTDTITGYIRGKNTESIPDYPNSDVDFYKVRNDICGFLTAKIPINSTAIQFQIRVSDSATGTALSTMVSPTPGGAVTDTLSIPVGTYYIEVSSYNNNVDPNPYTLYVTLSDCLDTTHTPTKIHEVNEVENISVYPNPNSGSFTISMNNGAGANSEQIKITVTNIIGEKLQEISANTTKPINMNLNQPNGVYFLTISTATSRYTKKIIINR